ncbi:filamentous hemagglutinin N-terminal domain-containing protein, partial [Candidatus Marithioploca araucensis]|nr:filamentous hemagglutinin N-terminal domain-containing protein [Candidatus Marithioploca araucensis]
ADLGQQRGGNLFHSFQDFNLNRAESATFSGPNSVNNVISRVTGGNPSQIDGLIRSTIPNADMYLLNPHGIMFGPNARLDVQGGFHASTADYLRLKEGGRFDARQPNNSILTVAPVEAFGFLTNSPAPLSVESSLLFVPPEKTLSLIGGNLTINQAELAAPYGRLNLASVAGIGEVIPKYDDFVVPTLRGDITVQDSLIGTQGEGGGAIYIRGGQFVLDNSMVIASSFGDKDGIGIDISAEQLQSDNAKIMTATFDSGQGGHLKIRATGQIILSDSILSAGTVSKFDNAGNGGTIEIEAKQLQLNDSIMEAETFGVGQGGNIHIKVAENITLSEKGVIFIQSSSYKDNAGDAGTLVLEANELVLSDGSFINAITDGAGQGGNIIIRVTDSIKLSGSGFFLEAGATEHAGNAGTLDLETGQLTLSESVISSKTYGPAQGGNIHIKVTGQVIISETSAIDLSSDNWFDEAGNIRPFKEPLLKSFLETTKSQQQEVAPYSVANDMGDAGNFVLEAGELVLKDSGISSNTNGSGQGGNINIRVAGSINLSGNLSAGIGKYIFGYISAYTRGTIDNAGKGGNIEIEAEQLSLTNSGAFISALSSGVGDGGNIYLNIADRIILSGGTVSADSFGRNDHINSFGKTDNAGNAGNIVLEAGELTLKDGALITVGTIGKGKGGKIKIRVNGTMSIFGIGNNKNTERQLTAILSSTRGEMENAGDAGMLEIEAGELRLAEVNTQIQSATFGTGHGGDVHVKVAGDIIISGQDNEGRHSNGIVTSSNSGADNAGDAGKIIINAGRIFIKNGGKIGANTNTADGGNITITSPGYIYLTPGGQITTSVGAEKGDGGNITLNPEFIILDNGKIIARAKEGQGGNIDINTTGIYKFPPKSASSIDASSELGIDGVVTIDSPNENVTEGLLTLPTTPIDTGTLSKDSCAVHSWEEYINRSRFDVHPIAGSPPSPYDLTPSRLSNTNKTDRQSSVIPEEQLF